MPPGGWQQPAPTRSPWATAPLASWWSRVGAALLDGLILVVPYVVLGLIVIAVAQISDVGAGILVIVGLLAYFVTGLFYAPVLMNRQGQHNGQTWGKQIVGIRVVRDSAEPFTLGSAFVREFVIKGLLVGVVGGFLVLGPLLDALWPLWDHENRALHDMVASSHVLQA